MSWNVFVDESIHETAGFIATAFLFGDDMLERCIEEQLVAHGLTPTRDEFKSSAPMRDNRALRWLRARLKRLLEQSRTPVAILFSAAARRGTLGHEITETLHRISANGFNLSQSEVFIDQGIRPGRNSPPAGVRLHFGQDSRLRPGIQAADLVAGMAAYALHEVLEGTPKEVPIHAGDTLAELGWVFKMQLRQNFLVAPRELVDDNIDQWNDAELLGHGVFLGTNLPPAVTQAAEKIFSRVWLGCTR